MSLPSLPLLPPAWESRIFGKQSISVEDGLSGDTEAIPDTERLAFIGDAVVHLGLTCWLHERYPQHGSQSLRAKLMDLVLKKPGDWAKMYKFQSHVVVTPSSGSVEPKPHPISKGDLFRAYIGAVYLHSGGDRGGGVITSGWIKQIMAFKEQGNHGDSESGSESDDSTQDEHVSTRGNNGDEISGMLNALLIPPREAPPKLKPPSQLPINIPVPNTRNYLSLLNEKAIRKKEELTWDENPTGPDHARTWEAKLTAGGKEFVGSGHNKKQAKSAASEVALKTLKWI